jgi:hypothetical protein
VVWWHRSGYGRVYFGPQAASGFELANGTDLADWAYGAQHLYARGAWYLLKNVDISPNRKSADISLLHRNLNRKIDDACGIK